MRPIVPVLLICQVWSGSAHTQPKPVELKTPTAIGTEPFTQVLAVRELSDGRVIVIDFEDKTVHLLDATLKPIKKIGRQGKGPGEYTMPIGLVPMPGDLTYLVDPLNQRLLSISPDGTAGDGLAFSSLSKGMVMMVSPMADTRGRVFFQGMVADIASLNADSAAIQRIDLATKQLETVAYFRPHKVNLQAAAGKVRLGAMKMFSPEEAWTATSDGRVARVIPEPYHLVFYADGGKPVVGPNMSYRPIPVTEEEKAEAKKAWEKGMERGRSTAAAVGGKAAANAFSMAEPEFAPTKPPFSGRTSALAGPNGEVWVERTRPYGEEGGLYDRFDRSGKLIGQVRLNPKTRVIGFGKQSVFGIRKDDDDLVVLERYGWR